MDFFTQIEELREQIDFHLSEDTHDLMKGLVDSAEELYKSDMESLSQSILDLQRTAKVKEVPAGEPSLTSAQASARANYEAAVANLASLKSAHSALEASLANTETEAEKYTLNSRIAASALLVQTASDKVAALMDILDQVDLETAISAARTMITSRKLTRQEQAKTATPG